MMFLPVNGAGGFVFTLYDYICTVLTVIPNSFGQMLFSTNRVTVMQLHLKWQCPFCCDTAGPQGLLTARVLKKQ